MKITSKLKYCYRLISHKKYAINRHKNLNESAPILSGQKVFFNNTPLKLLGIKMTIGLRTFMFVIILMIVFSFPKFIGFT